MLTFCTNIGFHRLSICAMLQKPRTGKKKLQIFNTLSLVLLYSYTLTTIYLMKFKTEVPKHYKGS